MMTPDDRDRALARLHDWRTGIALAGVAGVAAFAAIAAATIPGRADGTAGAAQVTDPNAIDQQQQQTDPSQGFGGFQPPSGGIGGGGAGRGHATSGGS